MSSNPQTPESVSACVRRRNRERIVSHQEQVYTHLAAPCLTHLVRRVQLRVIVALAAP